MALPSSKTSPVNAVDAVTTVLAAHVNTLYTAVRAMENALVPDGDLNLVSIQDNVTVSDPTTQLQYNDQLATILRLITGKSSWKTAPVTNIEWLVNNGLFKPAGIVGGDMLYWTTALARLAIGANGTWLRSNGTIPYWAALTAATIGAIPAPEAPAAGDTLVYNGSAWLPIVKGTNGQIWGMQAGMPAWVNSVPGSLSPGAWTAFDAAGMKVDLTLRSPAVVGTGGVLAEHALLQGAIDAAVTGQWVVAPPRYYDEDITLKSGVRVVELVRGTVQVKSITTAAGGYVSIAGVVQTQDAAQKGIICGHSSGTCEIHVMDLWLSCFGYFGATLYPIYCDTGNGTTLVYVDRIRASASEITGTYDAAALFCSSASATIHVYLTGTATITCPVGTAYGVEISAGAVNLTGGRISGQTADLYQTGGALNVYDCQYDPAKAVGVVTLLDGDRMLPAQMALFAGTFA